VLSIAGDTSFTRSSGPFTSFVTTLHGASRARWRVRGGIAVGQTCASRRNRHRGHRERTLRGSPRVYRFRKEGCVARKKRKEVAASVPARSLRARVLCPHVVVVAEVGRRRSGPK
jgi:hypothetical protein